MGVPHAALKQGSQQQLLVLGRGLAHLHGGSGHRAQTAPRPQE
jgi:hypothetical protein